MGEYKWWKNAVFYQIYPRSFADGNGDGIGDFAGMTAKLSYLQNLGIDAIWLSPIYPSPNLDWGYDISDYTNIAPEYGRMDDFIQFLEQAHRYSIKVILDLVLNHTSDEHPWFIESKSSRNNPKADWYIWHDSKKFQEIDLSFSPPNNWQSCFDGPAWTYSSSRSQYYYHYFMKQQPDLNWSNPEVKQAMWSVVRLWLDLGVDGFRLDAIGTIYEDNLLTPHSVPLDLVGLRYFSDTAQTPEEKHLLSQYWRDMFTHQWGKPGVHELMKELRVILDEYPGDRMLVGEDDNIDYLGNGKDELHLVFNFPLMRTDQLSPSHVRKNQIEYQEKLNQLKVPGWGCNTLGNHDSPRVINRYGNGMHDEEMARLNIALLLTLPGTPFLYYGEEIGMSDLLIEDPSLLRDTMATWYFTNLVKDLQVPVTQAVKLTGEMSRDKNRTPMQWINKENAGFCPPNIHPWLPVNPNYRMGVNVTDQENDSNSLLNFYRRILNIRKHSLALQQGDYLPLDENNLDTLIFIRSSSQQKVIIILNFTDHGKRCSISDFNVVITNVLITHPHLGNFSSGNIKIDPYGLVIAEVINKDYPFIPRIS